MEYAGEGTLQMFFCSVLTRMAATLCVDVGISHPVPSDVAKGTFVPEVAS